MNIFSNILKIRNRFIISSFLLSSGVIRALLNETGKMEACKELIIFTEGFTPVNFHMI